MFNERRIAVNALRLLVFVLAFWVPSHLFAERVHVFDDGSVLLVREALGGKVGLTKLLPSGQVDKSFGQDGTGSVLLMKLEKGAAFHPYGTVIKVDPQGKILVAFQNNKVSREDSSPLFQFGDLSRGPIDDADRDKRKTGAQVHIVELSPQGEVKNRDDITRLDFESPFTQPFGILRSKTKRYSLGLIQGFGEPGSASFNSHVFDFDKNSEGSYFMDWFRGREVPSDDGIPLLGDRYMRSVFAHSQFTRTRRGAELVTGAGIFGYDNVPVGIGTFLRYLGSELEDFRPLPEPEKTIRFMGNFYDRFQLQLYPITIEEDGRLLIRQYGELDDPKFTDPPLFEDKIDPAYDMISVRSEGFEPTLFTAYEEKGTLEAIDLKGELGWSGTGYEPHQVMSGVLGPEGACELSLQKIKAAPIIP